jgi:hypothetical protein
MNEKGEAVQAGRLFNSERTRARRPRHYGGPSVTCGVAREGGLAKNMRFCETNPPVKMRYMNKLCSRSCKSSWLKGCWCYGRWLPQTTAASRLTRLDKLSMTEQGEDLTLWGGHLPGATAAGTLPRPIGKGLS